VEEAIEGTIEEVTVRERIVILFSGGADSRALLELALLMGKEPFCLLIDYEQLHKEELDSAKKQLDLKKVKYQVVKISGLNITSALTGEGGGGRFGPEEEISPWYVPSRNLMFIAVAASVAEDLGIITIWYGADASDYENRFPDCIQEWVGRVNKVLEINGSHSIKLVAPLLGFSKEDVLSLLKSFNVKEGEYFSGYGDLLL